MNPLLILLAASTAPPPTETLTVSADRLLEVETGKILPHPVIRIQDGRIVSIEPRTGGLPVDLDLGDVTLLPGLIDAHVHLIGSEGRTPYDALRETTAAAAIAGVLHAAKTLGAGFTTVRDLGSRDLADVALRDAIANGTVPGPRMFVAVKGVSITGGHGDRNDLPPDVTVDRLTAVADGPDEVRKVVRENIKRGADWIKLLATGGVMSVGTDPRTADYSESELRTAIETARERGRDVAVHAHGTEGIKRAVRAGARSIEHASMLDAEAIELIRKHGTFLVPNPYTNLEMLERGAAGGFQPYQLAKGRELLEFKLKSLEQAVKAGLLVAYGTDSGVQPHGLNGRQFKLLVQAGMTPLDAIRAATVINARLLRLEGKIGTLAPGAFADLIAVRGDPLTDITVLESPVAVIKGGVRFK
jgi:imidazolonepropionase-like amidohydrolase